MKVAYFPGCTASASGKDMEVATQAVLPKFDIFLKEVPDWNCCGATSAHSVNQLLALALPLRVLAQAETLEGIEPVITAPCAACYNRLKRADWAFKSDIPAMHELREKWEVKYKGSLEVKHNLQLMHETDAMSRIKELLQRPLEGLKVACYYGCLLTRTPEVTGKWDSAEYPQTMDDILRATGAEVVEWAYKTECCGASFTLTFPQVIANLSGSILQNAIDSGANAIVTACPFCQMNLEVRQAEASRAKGRELDIPVYNFLELVGVAIGMNPEELGLTMHVKDMLTPLRVLNLL